MVNRKVYCETCERDVILHRKSLDHTYHEIVIILTIITLGIGYLILKLFQKKNRCPHCDSEFDLKNLSQYQRPSREELNQ